MIPGQFDYVRPASLDDALRILSDREGEAKLLSGGYSLLPLIKLRLAQPALLVDLQAITGLDGVRETDDHLVIGARATHRQVHDFRSRAGPLPGHRRPDLDDRRPAGPQLGHGRRQRRPCGPGERLAGVPARVATPRSSVGAQAGERLINARDFFLDTFQTAIEPTEVLTEHQASGALSSAAPTPSSSARSATSPRAASPRSSGSARRDASRAPASALTGSPRRRSPRPMPRTC